jgi:hypothetical protein
MSATSRISTSARWGTWTTGRPRSPPLSLGSSRTAAWAATCRSGRSTIERGQVRVGDPVELIGLGAPTKSVVTSVETFGKTMHSAQAGDNAALLLRGVGRHQGATWPGASRAGQLAGAPALRRHAAPAVGGGGGPAHASALGVQPSVQRQDHGRVRRADPWRHGRRGHGHRAARLSWRVGCGCGFGPAPARHRR